MIVSDGHMVIKEDVHGALVSLYAPSELAACTLAGLLAETADLADANQRARSLRRLLLNAIEELRPSGKIVPKASEYRAYDCISLRYISGLRRDSAEALIQRPPSLPRFALGGDAPGGIVRSTRSGYIGAGRPPVSRDGGIGSPASAGAVGGDAAGVHFRPASARQPS